MHLDNQNKAKHENSKINFYQEYSNMVTAGSKNKGTEVPTYGKPMDRPNANMSDLLADQYTREYLSKMQTKQETEEKRASRIKNAMHQLKQSQRSRYILKRNLRNSCSPDQMSKSNSEVLSRMS